MKSSDATRPAGSKPWITPGVIRGKHPDADLKLAYPATLRNSLLAAAVCLTILAFLLPEFESTYVIRRRMDPVIIIIDDLPETIQGVARRPTLDGGLSTEGVAEVDTVRDNEGVDLDYLAGLDLPGGMLKDMDLDEETVGFWTISREPILVKEVIPGYPQEARQAGLEGVVFVKFAVGSNGRVKKALVLKGPELFRGPALKAVYQFEFIPAIQNQRPVAVWMTLPIRFQLLDHYDPRLLR